MIEFSEVVVGTGGVAPCVRCRPVASIPAQPTAFAEIVSALGRAFESQHGAGAPNVILGGFEPFAHPELPRIIAAAADSGFARIRLRTDAGALSLAANARGAVVVGVRQIEVVLLGDEATHDRLTGHPGAFAAATAGCREFLTAADAEGAAVVVTGLVPACRHNIAAIGAAVAALAAASAVAVGIDCAALSAKDAPAVEVALETAAMCGVAGFVTNAPFPVARPFDCAPWSIVAGAHA